jgi:hypothetical protein
MNIEIELKLLLTKKMKIKIKLMLLDCFIIKINIRLSVNKILRSSDNNFTKLKNWKYKDRDVEKKYLVNLFAEDTKKFIHRWPPVYFLLQKVQIVNC